MAVRECQAMYQLFASHCVHIQKSLHAAASPADTAGTAAGSVVASTWCRTRAHIDKHHIFLLLAALNVLLSMSLLLLWCCYSAPTRQPS